MEIGSVKRAMALKPRSPKWEIWGYYSNKWVTLGALCVFVKFSDKSLTCLQAVESNKYGLPEKIENTISSQ